jgi:putative endonuclease
MTILDRRYRRRFGEIDLIARHGDLLVFVEVKARSGRGYGGPAAAVTRRKQRRMARVALGYLQERGWLERRCRFDVVEVLLSPGGDLRARHIPDAFRLWATG